MTKRLKLVCSAGGIYYFFIRYGRIQEQIFQYKSATGAKFQYVWFLQCLDALANILVGFVGRQLQGPNSGLPLHLFSVSGVSQVCAKYCLSSSLAAGLSFPVATLAKSCKLVPVMIGARLMAGTQFSMRKIIQAAAIVGGTSIVTLADGGGKKKTNSNLGILFILLSLTCDGVTSGVQKEMKKSMKANKIEEKPFETLFWTNFFSGLAAIVAAVLKSELGPGAKFLRANPALGKDVLKFALCGAMGQVCIFITIANFDNILCTAVTTTRKLISVLLSLSDKSLPPLGWAGLLLAATGMAGEVLTPHKPPPPPPRDPIDNAFETWLQKNDPGSTVQTSAAKASN